MIASLVRRTLAIAAERPRLAAWTLIAATCALFVAGGAALAADTADRWSQAPGGTPASLVVYLGEGVDEAHARVLAGELARQPGVERAELVPAAESAKRLQQALGADATLLDGVDLASLPASVEVDLAPGMRDVIAMSPTLRALRGTAGVDDVVIAGGQTVDRPVAVDGIGAITWIAAAVGGLALLAAFAALRVRLARDRRERAVLELLGARASFTAIPTALAGALHGAFAAAVAAAALVAVIAAYGDELARTFGGVLASPALPAIACFVAVGALIGLIGGAFAGTSR